MKRAAEVKRSLRCSEEPVAGDGSMSMCAAFSVTKRSPKLLAADGTMHVGVTKKRPHKADKPSKKDKRSEEKKKKRSKEKKRELEKQEAGDGFIDIKKEKRTMEDDNAAGGMTKLSQELLDYLRTKEVMGLLATEAPLLPWASKMGGALFESNQRLKEEIAAEFQENREFDAHVLYQYRTYGYAYAEIIKETGTTTQEKSNNKKKKLVTQEINQAEIGHSV